MANSVETNLLQLLQAMQEQKAQFAREAARIAERCAAEHASGGGDGGDDDVPMTDASASAGAGADTNGQEKPSTAETNTNGLKSEAAGAGPGTEGGLCRRCYNALLDLVHETYAAAAPAAAQWYAGRQSDFLAELDRLLDDVRQLRAPLQRIDEWVAGQKRAWLVGQLQEAAALQAVAKARGASSSGNAAAAVAAAASGAAAAAADLRAQLGRPDADVPQLLRAVVAQSGESLVADVQAAVQRLRSARAGSGIGSGSSSNNEQQGAIFRDTLFPRGVPDVAAARAVERRLLAGAVGLDEGLREALAALGGGGADEAARAAKMDKHRKRLAELRRAKAAHEAQKLKKMKAAEVPYFLQDATPCATCGRASDPQKSRFCIVCFLEVDYGLRENQTVWCTAACMRANFATHFAAHHACAAGDRCARARPEADIARQEPRYFFCRECVLSFSIGTFYCNDRCAGRDFQRHREAVHLPNRLLRADYRDDRGELSYSSYAKVDYTAADIAKHLLSIDDALASCRKKHPDWHLTETKATLTLPWPT